MPSSLELQLAPPAQPICAGVAGLAGWNTYESVEHRFLIEYPHDYALAERAFELAAPGAVVTFVPALDPSLNPTGTRTTLLQASVTVGVTPAAFFPGPGAPCGDCRVVRRPSGWPGYGDGHFLVCDRTEGAAGHRFSLLSYSTVCGGRRYQIVLYLDCANPDCYPPGEIRPFDRTEIVRVFEAMVDTFRCRSGGR
ncbi:MAG: hypothetical protein ACP5G2_08640 [Candidatus Bipolaricaulaceae bacterium]